MSDSSRLRTKAPVKIYPGMGAPGAPEEQSARKFRESGCFHQAAACALRNPPLPAEARPMRANSGALSKGEMDNIEEKINAAPLSAQ